MESYHTRNVIKSRRASTSSKEPTSTPVVVGLVGTPTAGEAIRVESAMSARVSFIVLLMSDAFEVKVLQNFGRRQSSFILLRVFGPDICGGSSPNTATNF